MVTSDVWLTEFKVTTTTTPTKSVAKQSKRNPWIHIQIGSLKAI